MSLRPSPLAPVPSETARVVQAAFPKGHPYLKLRDTFGALFQDAQFADLFSHTGQPAEAPWRLALVTLLQFAEHLSDRQAADAVRARLDWKYLLGLELTDPGFDYSVLCEFRERLLSGTAGTRLLELFLEHCRTHQLLKARGRQRTDSTHVLAAIRTLNRLELVGETFRHALNALAEAAPDWLREHLQPEWRARYARRWADQPLPQGQAARTALAERCGADGFTLLAALWDPATPAALRALPAVETLRQVWLQQFYREDADPPGRCQWRPAGNLPPAPEVIQSPVDPEAHYSRKAGPARETAWVGYKVHFTETCEPDQPLLITDVATTPAPLPDQGALAAIQRRLAARDLLPATHLADGGYGEAAAYATSEQQGVTLVAPPPADTSWQAQAGAGFATADFAVDWERQVARCPRGRESVRWQEKAERGRAVIRVHFARGDCAACPVRAQCTTDAGRGRLLTLLPQAPREALERARARAQTAASRATYAARSGIEGTHSQAVRRSGLRHCRYVGLAKTHLQHLATAAALNLIRVGEWLQGTPRARTREAAFLRLLAGAV